MYILIDAGNYFANNNNYGDRAIYQIIATGGERGAGRPPKCQQREIKKFTGM
jgi:hypothetical protein